MRSMTFKVDHSQAFPTYMIRKPYFVLSQAHHQVGITSRTGLLSINERSWVSYHIIEVGRLACPLLRFVGTTLGRYLGAPDLHYECLGERASRAHRRDHRCFLLLYIHTYSSNSAIFFIHKGGHFLCHHISTYTLHAKGPVLYTLAHNIKDIWTCGSITHAFLFIFLNGFLHRFRRVLTGL